MMFDLPAYVALVYGIGLTGAPLILFVPPPARVARHATLLCGVLLKLTAVLVALATMFMALRVWWPGLTLGGVALTVVTAMFWAACEPRDLRRRGDDGDEGSDDGGGPKRPPTPRDPDGPGGLDINWGEFDRQRAGWQRALPPAGAHGVRCP
jgi:hypothetical protein